MKSHCVLEQYRSSLSSYENIYSELEYWFSQPISLLFKSEILSLLKEGKASEVVQRFSYFPVFGTAGIRSYLGGGFSYLNEYSVALITTGFFHYMEMERFSRIVVVSFDSRNFSSDFSQIVAKTLRHYGCKVILFSRPTPSPCLAYAVSFFGASAGIMITASHNPKEYNGYKIYNQSAGQFSIEETRHIAECIRTASRIPLQEIVLQDNILPNLDEESKCILSYFKSILSNIPSTRMKHTVSVVYSPLFGTGKFYVPSMIEQMGGKLIVVEEQNYYDGNFPSCSAPNPELLENFDLAIEYSKKHRAPIAILTDPDADRVGVWENGKYFTGNELGIILSYFLASSVEREPKKTILISSVVSTQLMEKIKEHFGLQWIVTPTGFKHIGEYIQRYPNEFLFGFEESYGYLIGNYIQDKDAVGATALIYFIAQILYESGKTLSSFLEEIYQSIGYSETTTIEVSLEEIKALNPDNIPDKILGKKVLCYKNYGTQICYENGEKKPLSDPYIKEPLSLIQWNLEGNIRISVRASGTEPKIKVYTELFISKNTYADVDVSKSIIQEYRNMVQIIRQFGPF